jgi:hypothetical protein
MTLWHCLHPKFLQPSTVASVIRRNHSAHFLRARATRYIAGTTGTRRSAAQASTKLVSNQRTDYKGSGVRSYGAFLICGAYFAWFGTSAFNQAKALEQLESEEDDHLGDPFDSTLNTTLPPSEPPRPQSVVVQNKVVNLEQVNDDRANRAVVLPVTVKGILGNAKAAQSLCRWRDRR